MHLSMLSPREGGGGGGSGIGGHLIFLANFQSNAPPSGNKYWSNAPPFCNKLIAINTMLIKVVRFKLPQLRAKMLIKNPQGEDAIDDQIPHICPTPPSPSGG